MSAVDQSPFGELKFSVSEERENGFRTVDDLTVTAADVEADPDHPLRGLSEFGFDEVEVSGEIVHGKAQILVTAQTPFRWPERAFVDEEVAGDEGLADKVVLELSAQSDGRRIMDVVVHGSNGLCTENNIDADVATEAAWAWLESVRDGVSAALEREHRQYV